MGDTRALYNANDGLTGRDGGPYLDLEEARLAEERRARIEGRKPDLDNPPASAGIVLLTASQALANAGVNNLPSQDDKGGLNHEAAVKAIADDENTALTVAAEVPAEAFEDDEEAVDTSMRSALATDGTAPAGESNTVDLPDTSSDSKGKSATTGTAKSATDKSEDPAGTKSTAK